MDLNAALQACYHTYQSGDLQTAEQQCQQIVTAHPNATDAYHLGALIMMRSGQFDQAIQRIETAISGQPNHHEYWNTKGSIFAGRQNVPLAVDAYQQCLRLKSDYLPASQNLGRCLVDNDDPEWAIGVYESGIGHHPRDEQLRIGHVIALRGAIRSQEALDALDKWEAELNGAQTYDYVRGQILVQLGEDEKAIAANKRALQDQNVSAPALKNLLQLYWMRGEWETGEAELQTLLADSSAPLGLFLGGAQTYVRIQQQNKALDILDQATEKFGNTPDIGAARGQIALESGDFEESYQLAKEALTARPGDLGLMETYASAALVSGRPNDAMIAAHSALRIQPNNQFWIAIKYTAGRAMGQNYQFYADTEKYVKAYTLEPPKKYGSLEIFNAELKKALVELHNYEQQPLDQSLLYGTQTPTDLRFAKSPVIQDFFAALDVPIHSYMDELGQNPIHPIDNRNTGNYRLAGAWSVRLGAGGHHVNHVHPKGWISSSYYVDVPPEVNDGPSHNGWIQFNKPPYEIKDVNGAPMQAERFVKPEPGLVVLFPSYMWHGTVPIEGDESRMTLPFDVVPA